MPSTIVHSYTTISKATIASPSRKTPIQESQSIPMEKTSKIIRRSIYTYLQHYQYFTTTSVLLAFPFSASILLSQSLLPSLSLLPPIHNRLRALFQAAGFPPSSEFFTILNFKLSQTITSSILVLPFTLSFLLIAKASIIQALNHHKPPSHPRFSFSVSHYNPLLLTQLCNSLVLLAVNATCFSLLFVVFNCLDGFNLSSPTLLLFLSATGVVLYSIVLANVLIICNLALVLSGTEKCGGYMAILKACILIKGRTPTALSLALPVNMTLAAIEALFQYRVVRAFSLSKNPNSSIIIEGAIIAYLYSILIVLDTISCCVLFNSCKTACRVDHREEGRNSYWVDIEEECGCAFAIVKTLEEIR